MNRRAFVRPGTSASVFSCDWGTTSFRLRKVEPRTGAVLDECGENAGVSVLLSMAPPGDPSNRERVFRDFLRKQLAKFATVDAAAIDGASVIVSGMASSSVGWRELPYAEAPFNLDGSNLVHQSFDLNLEGDQRARVSLISGVRTKGDIMRGEETEIVGIFADGRFTSLAEDGILVLPGTHSKHVRLQRRQLTDFRTYVTGELFDVLSRHSLLRASVKADEERRAKRCIGRAKDAFVQGVAEASENGLAAGLFQVRVRTVLKQAPLATNHWFLSGLLIGSELCDLATGDRDAPILLAAQEPLSSAYELAFRCLGLAERVTVLPPEEVALAAVRGHVALMPWLDLQRNDACS
jgi:2-dehydro-3-deoxygalactonokinase